MFFSFSVFPAAAPPPPPQGGAAHTTKKGFVLGLHKESRATLACLYRSLGRVLHATIHAC